LVTQAATPIYAQLGFPSDMFDSACYFPQVGKAGEIDTIYGSVPRQYLGNALVGICPAPGSRYNRIAFQGFENVTDSAGPNSSDLGYISPPFSFFQGGSGFDLHKMQPTTKNSIPLPYCQFVHLRSREYLDAVYHTGARDDIEIFWADANGNYDSSRVTLLKDRPGTAPNSCSPFIGNFSHDSTYDILMFYMNLSSDSVYLAWFDGQHLFGKSTAWADSTIFFDTIGPDGSDQVRIGTSGDFQGSGRMSFIESDADLNLHYFSNSPPFSLGAFVNAMKFDTLLSLRENPSLGEIDQRTFGRMKENSIAMQAFPKASGDHSVDFLTLQFDSLDKANNYPEHIYCFKGGQTFGTKRLYLGSADYLLHTPQEYNIPGFGLDEMEMHNCGDMTGTGNNVLELYGEYGNGLNSFYFFYVTGKALDSKVDMAYEIDPNGHGTLDTLTADGDRLEDLIIGIPYYNSYQDVDSNRTLLGTVHVVHGSKKIPVHLSPVFDVATSELASGGLEVYPNPAATNVSLVLRGLSREEVSIVVRDMLGREVLRAKHRCTSDAELYSIGTENLASGSYVVQIVGPKPLVCKLTILR
jgi:hypothetical protein